MVLTMDIDSNFRHSVNYDITFEQWRINGTCIPSCAGMYEKSYGESYSFGNC